MYFSPSVTLGSRQLIAVPEGGAVHPGKPTMKIKTSTTARQPEEDCFLPVKELKSERASISFAAAKTSCCAASGLSLGDCQNTSHPRLLL